METITSELKFTDIDHRMPVYNLNYYKDQYSLMYEPNFTEHLHACSTRYSPVFYHYLNDSIIGTSLAFYGEYTETEINLLRSFLNSDSVIYDIGANIGVHTVAFAKGTKHVYAFEPNNLNYKLLEINSYYDKNISLFDFAISNEVGSTQIESFSLGTSGNYGECKITSKGQHCPMTTIDYLVERKEILPPTLIKIDVEGHEFSVFQGMEKTIKNHMPVIFYEAMHCDLAGIYDMLSNLSYTLYWYPVANYNPNNFYNNKENIFGNGGVLNILAVPPSISIKTNMPLVIDRLDTWAQVVERLQNVDAKKD